MSNEIFKQNKMKKKCIKKRIRMNENKIKKKKRERERDNDWIISFSQRQWQQKEGRKKKSEKETKYFQETRMQIAWETDHLFISQNFIFLHVTKTASSIFLFFFLICFNTIYKSFITLLYYWKLYWELHKLGDRKLMKANGT